MYTRSNIYGLIEGKRVAQKYLTNYPNSKLFFTFERIGDLCMMLAYLGYCKKKDYGYEYVILTTNPGHAVFKYFSNEFDSVVQISKNEHDALFGFYRSNRSRDFQKQNNRLVCAFFTAHVAYDILFYNRYVSIYDLQKQIYHLDKICPPCKVMKDDNDIDQRLISNMIIEKNKTVLMNPYAQSIMDIPIELFNRLSDVLICKGFRIITSTVGEQKAVRGTQGVCFSLSSSVELADYCGYVIGVRSGFMDLISFSDAQIIVIDSDNYPLSDAVRLEEWRKDYDRIKTYRYTGTLSIVNSILDWINNSWSVCI